VRLGSAVGGGHLGVPLGASEEVHAVPAETGVEVVCDLADPLAFVSVPSGVVRKAGDLLSQ
jgi:hypothetical protein